MAFSKVPEDWKELLQAHTRLKQQLLHADGLGGSFEQQVRSQVDSMIREQVRTQLQEIPVEELNRAKQGVRVKTLRDSGFRNLAELDAAGEQALAAINGISDEGAAEICQAVSQLSRQLQESSKIRISADDRREDAGQLLTALIRYSRGKAPVQSAHKLLVLYGGNVDRASADLAPARSGLRWVFSSGNTRQLARDAYRCLRELWDGDYGTEARQSLDSLAQLEGIPAARAWDIFLQDPIPLLNTLEQLCPGAVGTEDPICGLPETLAHDVQSEPVYTKGLKCTLRPYQLWGVRYILRQKRVLLGDEMGLGKTVQAIAAMVSLRNTGGTHFLVVCPASVMENWCRELRRHSDLPVLQIHGSHREEVLAQWQQQGGTAVTTYETTGAIRLPPELRVSMVVADEAHYIKNPRAQRSRNVRRLCKSGERLLFMTGTALENRVDEMLTLMQILQPQVASAAREQASLASAPQFRELVAPVYYRRRREDVLTELPELIESQEWCTLGRAEKQVYEDAVLGNRFADARRVSWNVDDLSGSSKAARMLELIREAEEEGRKVIVFSFFLDTIGKVISLLGPRCLSPINGSIPPQRRQEIVDEFTAAPPGTVLPAQIQAGGTGLNIQAASVVILCEPQFKPSTENQAISRAYRMGQTRRVLAYRLLCEDTVDERITEILEEKQAAFDAFADESAAARESLELDQASFGKVMEAEARRIRGKNPPDSGLAPAKGFPPGEAGTAGD